MVAAKSSSTVATLRAFNRFYTRRLGLLNARLLDSRFSLTEARVIFEVGNQPGLTATEIMATLGLDRGYMSRLLQRLQRLGLIERVSSQADGRQRHLRLTTKGRALFARLDARATGQVAEWLEHLPPAEQQRLGGLVRSAWRLLGSPNNSPVTLREPRAGEFGWVVQRHGAIYAAEYAWDETFEGLVAKIVGDFASRHDAARERCWIAAIDDEPLGCVFLMKRSQTVGQLRLLLVEPTARGKGIGQQLVGACIAFAREVGYQRIQLWTNSVLHAARRIYEGAGFQLIESEKHHSFGHQLVGQTWELNLRARSRPSGAS